MSNYRKTLVATVMMYDKPPEEARMMAASARYHGIELCIVGEGVKYQSNFHAKIVTLFDALKDFTEYDHIIMADGGDTLFATGLGEMFTKWELYNSDFVIAAEGHCWPFPKKYQDITPGAPARFRFLNSGFYMATWDAWLRTMKQLHDMPFDGYTENDKTIQNEDQGRFYTAWMEKRIQVTLDTECRLSQSMSGIDKRRSFLSPDILWGRRPINKITGQAPCTFHCNGVEKWRIPELWDMLKV
jgi:hypothetical protein